MKHIFYTILIIFTLSLSCFGQGKTVNDSLFIEVSSKLKSDKKSFKTFQAIYKAYMIDLEMKYISLDCLKTLYIMLYNKGVPIARLVNEESIIEAFELLNNKDICHKSIQFRNVYKKLIADYSNYNTDVFFGSTGDQEEYFLKFLNEYFIIPDTK